MKRHYKFNPSLATPEVLQKTVIGREAEVLRILRKIKECGEGTSLRHFLIIGPRGIGKTHLILLVYHTVKGAIRWNGEYAGLDRAWIPIRFAEEEYRIASLGEFLVRVLEESAKEVPDSPPVAVSEGPRRSTMFQRGEEVEELLGRLLQVRERTGRRLLLLVDNFHQILQRLTAEDKGRLRDILMTKDLFLVIGAAPTLFDQVSSYDEPFYNFFEIVWLGELDAEQSAELFRRWWDQEDRLDSADQLAELRPRINALVHLTGGNPRLILSVYSIVAEASVSEVEQAFIVLLDELTPYFQSRMNELPEQQAKILDTMALMQGPSTPTAIAREANLEVGKVTSQLNRMRRAGYVTAARERGERKALYDVKERLFRLWRQMRVEAGRRYLSFVITVIKAWYTEEELEEQFVRVFGRFEVAMAERTEEAARDALKHMLYIEKASPPHLSSAISLARVSGLIEVGDIDVAEAEIERLAREGTEKESQGDSANVYWLRAHLCHQAGAKEDEIDALERYLDLRPDMDEAWHTMGGAYYAVGRYEEAIEAYRKAVEIKPDMHEAWYRMGGAYYAAGRYEEAIEACRKAVELKPDMHAAWNNMGGIYGQQGRHEEAIEACRKAVEIRPDKHEAWYNMGTAYYAVGSYEEAIGAYGKAVGMKPDDHEAWHTMGGAYYAVGRYEEAIEAYRKAVETKPDRHETWYNMGGAYGQQGRYEEAIEAWGKAVEIKPDMHEAWYNMGGAYFGLARYEEAIEAYRKAVEIKPDMHEAWTNMGGIYGRQGRYEEAIEACRKAVEIKPDLHQAWNNMGGAYAQQGRYEEAIEAYRKAVETKPDMHEAWTNMGSAYFGLERHEEALEACSKAIAIQPDAPFCRLNRSRVWVMMGKTAKALKDAEASYRAAEEGGMEELAKEAAAFALTLSLDSSAIRAARGRPELGETQLRKSLVYAQVLPPEKLQEILAGFLNTLIATQKPGFLKRALAVLDEAGLPGLDELLRFYQVALQYLETKDRSVLNQLFPELRELLESLDLK